MRREPEMELGAAERSLPVSRKLEEAQRAHDEAREHRRLKDLHHRQQREARRRFDAFRLHLEALGIEVVIEDHTSPKGGNSGPPGHSS